MPNNLYQQMQGQRSENPIELNFMDFMGRLRGQNPRAIINQMVQSGQISQQQLNVVQQRAQQMQDVFGQFKSRFGF